MASDATTERDRARTAIARLATTAGVRDTTLIHPDVDPRRTWVVQCVVAADAVPPRVLGVLAACDLALVDVDGRTPDHVIVTAEVPR